jgi:hypothetical protein
MIRKNTNVFFQRDIFFRFSIIYSEESKYFKGLNFIQLQNYQLSTTAATTVTFFFYLTGSFAKIQQIPHVNKTGPFQFAV